MIAKCGCEYETKDGVIVAFKPGCSIARTFWPPIHPTKIREHLKADWKAHPRYGIEQKGARIEKGG